MHALKWKGPENGKKGIRYNPVIFTFPTTAAEICGMIEHLLWKEQTVDLFGKWGDPQSAGSRTKTGEMGGTLP